MSDVFGIYTHFHDAGARSTGKNHSSVMTLGRFLFSVEIIGEDFREIFLPTQSRVWIPDWSFDLFQFKYPVKIAMISVELFYIHPS